MLKMTVSVGSEEIGARVVGFIRIAALTSTESSDAFRMVPAAFS